jgi:signal peptide peptidase SppA
MHYLHVLSLLSEPLALDRLKLTAIVDGLGPRLAGQPGALRGPAAVARSDRPYMVTKRGIAVVPVVGLLVHRAGTVSPASAPLRSYMEIGADMRRAMADAAVRAVVLDIDSPGGQVNGCFELAASIRRMHAQKPVVASVVGEALSAGYAIAAAAGAIYLQPSSVVGSIGILAVHRDQSKADLAAGLAYTFITAGARKADGHSHAPLSERARADINKDVQALYQMFVDQVAVHRGIPAAAVCATEAARYHGPGALKARLADRIGGLDDAIAEAERRAAARATTAPRKVAAAAPRAAAPPPPPQTARAVAPGSPPAAATAPVVPRPPSKPQPPVRAARTQADIDREWDEAIRRMCGSVRQG